MKTQLHLLLSLLFLAGQLLAQPVITSQPGNLFIANTANNVIRKVATNGMATIVAGNGSLSFSGDGGAATNAGLANPVAVAVDLVGNLFIADTSNNRIRRVGTNGIISRPFSGCSSASSER